DDSVPERLTVLPNPKLFRAARWMQVASLAVAAFATIFALLSPVGMAPNLQAREALKANLPMLLTGLFCAIGLGLSGPEEMLKFFVYIGRIARLLAMFGAAIIIFWARALSVSGNPLHAFAPPARLVVGFALLAVSVLLIDAANEHVNRIVDGMICALCLLGVLILADYFYTHLGLLHQQATYQSAALLTCLIALTMAVTLRQAEHGVLSVFLGVGMGSKMARIFGPIVLIISFAWEALNIRVSGQFAAALLTATVVAVFTGILLIFAWRISRMENEIHDLVLRDEATRLYNRRGFQLLAEHALRLAKRTGVPFSVLFIEMENLADIHAELGPEAAGASLAEAGEILRATFRETDIKGRIGADQFAVAGRFDRTGISVAALRLEFATAARASKRQGPVPLKLSMGHVTTLDSTLQESLEDLLQRAGHSKNRVETQVGEMQVN
ncbi:MAG TPA: GGDEF domain-containing protein, partial [Terracidiphilus sp.]|nr:GGDEF domain-containing protein [Terracidiphilus sp.]